MGKKDYSHIQDFVFVCTGSDCKPDSKSLQKSFKEALDKNKLKKVSKVIKTKCTGRCKEAPVVIVGNEWLGHVRPSDADGLVKKHFVEKG
jgi:NADH:ubiquinone oxidoreductase subunit E